MNAESFTLTARKGRHARRKVRTGWRRSVLIVVTTTALALSGVALAQWWTRRPEVAHQFGDPPDVGFRRQRPVHRLFEPRGGDEFHRPRDLANVADGLTPFDDRACLAHDPLSIAPLRVAANHSFRSPCASVASVS